MGAGRRPPHTRILWRIIGKSEGFPVLSHDIFSDLRHVNLIVGCTFGMGTEGFMAWVRGFW